MEARAPNHDATVLRVQTPRQGHEELMRSRAAQAHDDDRRQDRIVAHDEPSIEVPPDGSRREGFAARAQGCGISPLLHFSFYGHGFTRRASALEAIAAVPTAPTSCV